MLASVPCALPGCVLPQQDWGAPGGHKGGDQGDQAGAGTMLGQGTVLPSFPAGFTAGYCLRQGIKGFLSAAVFPLTKHLFPLRKTTPNLL